MRNTVAEYVRSCPACQKTKSPRHSPYGYLKPLPAPSRPFESISLDFMTDLPASDGHDAILVIVDRFSKYTIAIQRTKSLPADELFSIFVGEVLLRYGPPKSIISDRGPQFISQFWKLAHQVLGTRTNLSTAHHAQTDGQTERANQEVLQFIRLHVNSDHNNWASLLQFASFAINCRKSKTTGYSRFQALHGYPSSSLREGEGGRCEP
ncbi:hypothetical protein TRICI_003698 [Trichomonascus ciferrii]|uniref:Integrase catalytic domain-containing protein n=1 Tax=Trichomonascus ciferrii TaxID=44093 RepID=A0A642V9A9_9ASCO|nr:hypothetical protein TRICI_003698 [Trichomonascus ciferrii]